MQTAQAALAFVNRISEADKDTVVQGIASAVIATSATAMGEVVKKVKGPAAILEDATPWEQFERLRQLPEERARHARDILETVKTLLTRDEHVMPLVQGIKAAQLAVVDALTERVEPPVPPPSRRPSPSAPPPSAQPGAANSQRGLGLPAATAVFEGIARALAANPTLLLDIDWRLYTKDKNAS
jgi:hypothetical protein